MLQALQFAGRLNRHQEDLIDYLREENRVLREQVGCRPLQLTDAQRRRLAMRGKALGRRALTRVAGIVTRDTIRAIHQGMECLNRVVLLGESHLRLIVREYVEHYYGERNHQGLDNRLAEWAPAPVNPGAEVHRRERIGGLLNYYHREAA